MARGDQKGRHAHPIFGAVHYSVPRLVELRSFPENFSPFIQPLKKDSMKLRKSSREKTVLIKSQILIL